MMIRTHVSGQNGRRHRHLRHSHHHCSDDKDHHLADLLALLQASETPPDAGAAASCQTSPDHPAAAATVPRQQLPHGPAFQLRVSQPHADNSSRP